MSTIEVKVPALGEFKDVPIIDVLVKPGDAVSKDDALVTLESEKAKMDVPSPEAGTVRELKVKVGDRERGPRCSPSRRRRQREKAAAKGEEPPPRRRLRRARGARPCPAAERAAPAPRRQPRRSGAAGRRPSR
jgi:pyruvate/2-oxoglutarate dehydrogenase complex dihydrolipoamide acyltransferase (E2) component